MRTHCDSCAIERDACIVYTSKVHESGNVTDRAVANSL